MDISTFGTGEFIGTTLIISLVALTVALLLFLVAVGLETESRRSSGIMSWASGIAAAFGITTIVLVMPIGVIATFFYTPPTVPVPASTVTLTESDGPDTQRFDVVCSNRTGEMEIVGKQVGDTFTAGAYRFRAERGDISEPAQFSVGLRWENKGWGGRFGGQPSWMENVVSGGSSIRADGTWQAGYLDRPIILSGSSEYVLRVNLGNGPCPHLIALR